MIASNDTRDTITLADAYTRRLWNIPGVVLSWEVITSNGVSETWDVVAIMPSAWRGRFNARLTMDGRTLTAGDIQGHVELRYTDATRWIQQLIYDMRRDDGREEAL